MTVSIATIVLLVLPQLAPPISYRLSYTDGASVEVRIELPDSSRGAKTFVMPRAIPMGYGEQPFDRFVGSLSARSSDGTALDVVRVDGPRWRIGGAEDVLTHIRYEVDVEGMEREILSAADSSRVRPGYLSLLGYSVFGYVEGYEERPAHLTVDVAPSWPVLSTLAPEAPPPRGRAGATADNFYALADAQIVAGPALVVRRLEARVPLFLALYAEGSSDAAFTGELIGDVMGHVVTYFGTAPFRHYTVLQELLQPVSERHSYGFSMEHLDSSTFYLSAERGLTASSTPRELARSRYNFAHHFVHAWIPKRAYGKGYYPFTWELAPVLDTIWFSEGFAQYAALEALADALPDDAAIEFRQNLMRRRFHATLDAAPLFLKKMSLVELSRIASTRYSEDFRTGQNVFSRGALMAAEMDQLIRKQSDGTERLRHALRHLMAWSEEHQRAFRIEELPDLIEEATGVDTRGILERWLSPPAN